VDTHEHYALRSGSEQRLRTLQRAFRALHAKYDWRFDSWRTPWRRLSRFRYWAVPAALGAGLGFAAIAFLDLSERFGSADLAARHLLAARNCDAVRAQGLAPARRGHPGYHEWLDRDQDGIACEPWPR
jgi:hypothetical protein